jgi:hypothetical protein
MVVFMYTLHQRGGITYTAVSHLLSEQCGLDSVEFVECQVIQNYYGKGENAVNCLLNYTTYEDYKF